MTQPWRQICKSKCFENFLNIYTYTENFNVRLVIGRIVAFTVERRQETSIEWKAIVTALLSILRSEGNAIRRR